MSSRSATCTSGKTSPTARDLPVARYHADQRPATHSSAVPRADQAPHGPIRVVLMEDNRLARDRLAALLDAQPDFTVVATAACATTGLAHVRATRPHVALIDAALDTHDSHRWLKDARSVAPEARVILMNVLPVQEEIIGFIQAGANGFILKGATLEEFVGTIRSVAQGTAVIPTSLTSTLLSYIAGHASVGTPSGVPSADARMTRREQEIAHLIAEGLSNKEIARRLNIAIYTVKSHVHNVMDKLGLHSRVQIAACARWAGARRGSIDPGLRGTGVR